MKTWMPDDPLLFYRDFVDICLGWPGAPLRCDYFQAWIAWSNALV